MLETVGIIMDGNRRYAKSIGKSTIDGHTAGYEKLLEVCEWFREEDIKNLVVYAFSTENWNRSEEEVTGLMSLLAHALRDERLLAKAGTTLKIKIIGNKNKFSPDLQKAIDEVEEKSKFNTPHTLYIALSYGGRDEIVHAANSLLTKMRTVEQKDENTQKIITEDTLAAEMWLTTDPEIIIRTGGDKRLSNFLLWQSAYSELFFVDTLWPAFTRDEFKKNIEEFNNRKRNFGK